MGVRSFNVHIVSDFVLFLWPISTVSWGKNDLIFMRSVRTLLWGYTYDLTFLWPVSILLWGYTYDLTFLWPVSILLWGYNLTWHSCSLSVCYCEDITWHSCSLSVCYCEDTIWFDIPLASQYIIVTICIWLDIPWPVSILLWGYTYDLTFL